MLGSICLIVSETSDRHLDQSHLEYETLESLNCAIVAALL